MDWSPALLFPHAVQQAAEEVLALRSFTESHGLALTEAQAQMLAQTRQRALQATGRLEFGGSILPKLVLAFGGSPYVTNYSFAGILAELTVLFYAFKNETMDGLSDDELITLMRDGFDGPCFGSVEALADQLDARARQMRGGGDKDEQRQEGDDDEWN